jgi:DNA transformation protein
MSLAASDATFAVELFAGLPAISTRKMMGGLSLYSEGTIFAKVHGDGTIWLKGSGDFGDVLEAAGARRWILTRDNGKTSVMPYWTLPEAALDDPETACEWAHRALEHL